VPGVLDIGYGWGKEDCLDQSACTKANTLINCLSQHQVRAQGFCFVWQGQYNAVNVIHLSHDLFRMLYVPAPLA
jgi:hypothetical protein